MLTQFAFLFKFAIKTFTVQVNIVSFLLAKYYPEEFIKLRPMAIPGNHDNPKAYLLEANRLLVDLAKDMDEQAKKG